MVAPVQKLHSSPVQLPSRPVSEMFQATTRFDEGVRRCVAYILAHPELQVEDLEFDAWCDQVIEAQENAKAQMKNKK